MNPTLGIVLSRYFGGTAIVAASALSLALGYVIVLVSYHLENRVPFRVLLPVGSAGIVLSSFVGALIFLPFFSATRAHSLYSLRTASGLIAAAFTMIIFPIWVHPFRKRVFRWFLSRMPA